MVFPAVHLNHKAVGRPVGVDLMVEDRDVGERSGQVGEVLPTELGEPVLQRRSRIGRHACFAQQETDRAQSAATVAPLADLLELFQPQDSEPISLFPGTVELPAVDDFGEVEESSGDGRDRNPGALSRVTPVKTTAM